VQRRFGVRSVLCVPLLARDEVLGVIFFNQHHAAVAFTPQTVDFAGRLAAAIASALENARMYEEQQRIAETLQENFIHEPPAVSGLELGVVTKTAYEPELVGGDFSDVFAVDDGRVVVLIADVAGKGVHAAGLTETVRSTVRAFATIEPSPAFILAKTNELLLRFDPDEPHVTAFLAVLDPQSGGLSYASAGHPSPVHVSARACRPLDVAFGPPLGSFAHDYRSAHAVLTLEDYLVLYTDGVTEARRDGELLGERRLLEIVEELRGRSAQAVAEGVRDAVLAYGGRLRDDLQVVVLRLA
jgi:serine phosphatase RsbU (regulator of sigma subunit)